MRIGLAAIAAAFVIGALAASAQAEVPFKTITSSGPLTNIAIGNEGSCQISHQGDAGFEIYPSSTTPGDCGTLVFAGNVLYAPAFGQHGSTATSSLGASTPHTPVSQSEVTGSGSSATPFTVTTVYTLGTTGIRVTEVDTYVTGQEFYKTSVTLQNTGGATQTGIIYRAGDCYLQESDTGFGFLETSNNGPGCSRNANNSPAGRIEQWVPLTSGSAYMEDRYATVWQTIAAHTMLPNTVQATTALDNGAGLSWQFNLAAGRSATFQHLTVFSPTGVTGGQQQPAATPTPTGAQALPLPSNRRCTSKRAFPIKVRQFRGLRYETAIVAVNGRRVPVFVYTTRRIKVTKIGAVYLNRKRFRAFVDLRGLVRGTYAVRVTAVTSDGQVLVATRNYRTCTRKLGGTIPRL